MGTFDVYVSDNGGPWTLWQNQTAVQTANYTGQLFHSYAFYAVGYDNVGNVEPNVPATETTTIATDEPMPATMSTVSMPEGSSPSPRRRACSPMTRRRPARPIPFKCRSPIPTHGTLTLKPDGSFIYIPDGTFTGLDSFTYQTKDSDNVLGNVATVTLATQLANFKSVKVSATEAKGTANLPSLSASRLPPSRLSITRTRRHGNARGRLQRHARHSHIPAG